MLANLHNAHADATKKLRPSLSSRTDQQLEDEREKKLRIPLVESLLATSGAVSPKKQVCREEISCCSVLRFRPPGLRHGEMGGGRKKVFFGSEEELQKRGRGTSVGGFFLRKAGGGRGARWRVRSVRAPHPHAALFLSPNFFLLLLPVGFCHVHVKLQPE